MTSEIEAKRKELEEKIYASNNVIEIFTPHELHRQELEYFNLACKMKDKEFLEWLNEYYKHEVSDGCICDGCQNIRNKIKELKQSLGEKGK